MNQKLLTLALLGMVAALGAQPAVAGTHHVTTKVERHVMSERVRNANAYSAPLVAYPAAGAPYGDEALSPPAGH
jgi:hypothetical protein